MLVTGSIISPRIFISTSMRSPFSLHSTVTASPAREFGPARVTRTRQVLAGQSPNRVSDSDMPACVKLSVRFCDVRPIHCPVA